MLSSAWKAAGGTAIRYDQRRDEPQYFSNDHAFGDEHLENPRDFYNFTIPCHQMSVARTTPSKARSVYNPSGDERDGDIAYYNDMADLMYSRLWVLASNGAAMLTEQPLLSYLYLRRVHRGFLGAPGVLCLRSHGCMASGNPWQKPRGRTIYCRGIVKSTAAKCDHGVPHAERLVGSKTRLSAPYGRYFVIVIVSGAT